VEGISKFFLGIDGSVGFKGGYIIFLRNNFKFFEAFRGGRWILSIVILYFFDDFVDLFLIFFLMRFEASLPYDYFPFFGAGLDFSP
jgi:hypothetical protein